MWDEDKFLVVPLPESDRLVSKQQAEMPDEDKANHFLTPESLAYS